MGRVFFGNFDFEHQLAGDSPRRDPRLLQRQELLAFSWLLVAGPDDAVVLPRRFESTFLASEPFRGSLPDSFWHVAGTPGGVERIEPLKDADRLKKWELVPWGWTEGAISLAERSKLGVDGPPIAAVRAANSRRFSAGLEAEWDVGLPEAGPVASVEQLAERLRGLADDAAWVVKAEYGMSARERILGRGKELTQASAHWVTRRLARDHVVFYEPWVDREEEAGIQIDIPKAGSPQLVGVTGLLNDERGSYLGSRFHPDEALVSRFAPAVDLALAAAVRAQALGYFGPFGVDAMRYRSAGGALRLRGLQDVNARWTMGRVSLGARRWIRPGEQGEWIHLRVGKSSELSVALEDFVRRQPAGTSVVRTSPLEIDGVPAAAVAVLRFTAADGGQ